eukprot:TRINITY_DN4215_c0_g1_i1.p1 TRINITY_DN4215_c0_g1~~TRINITY_DN4215_c0_g1_i1.p1  ORF type:complete len:198 (-),score=32.58 TRINITY_DN4215_c0_g1_i1:812-1369(-)
MRRQTKLLHRKDWSKWSLYFVKKIFVRFSPMRYAGSAHQFISLYREDKSWRTNPKLEWEVDIVPSYDVEPEIQVTMTNGHIIHLDPYQKLSTLVKNFHEEREMLGAVSQTLTEYDDDEIDYIEDDPDLKEQLDAADFTAEDMIAGLTKMREEATASGGVGWRARGITDYDQIKERDEKKKKKGKK